MAFIFPHPAYLIVPSKILPTAFPPPFCNALEMLFKSQESAEKAPIARNWLLDLHRHS